jgi:hypothetical protein
LIIIFLISKQVTVVPAFGSLPAINYTYSIFRRKVDNPSFFYGLPEFHVRVVSLAEGEETYHASPLRLGGNQYAGGLTATYYGDPDAWGNPIWSTPCCASTPCEETIDFSLSAQTSVRAYGSGSVGTDTMRGWSETGNLPSFKYGIRWSGSISPTISGLYTFHATSTADLSCGVSQRLDDRLKLWIDDILVIDQWASLTATTNVSGTFQFQSSYPSYYPISVTYKNTDNKTCSGLQLQWQNFNIGTTRKVVPSIRLFPLSGQYSVAYTPTLSGDYQVHASLAQGFGLDATFYSDQYLTNVSLVTTMDNINFNAANQSVISEIGLFSVRWAGLLSLGASVSELVPAVVTFEASIAETDERVKLWVDNTLIIDRWDTYGELTATSFSATVLLFGSTSYYDIKMEYKQVSGQLSKAVLSWSCSESQYCNPKSVIPSSNLFLSRESRGSPFPPHHIYPAPTCISSCKVSGIILSLGTAGVTDSFTLQAYDSFGNHREIGSDMWTARAIPFNLWDAMEPYADARTSQNCQGCTPLIATPMTDMEDGSYVATFAETIKGVYKVLIILTSIFKS